jgi:sulfatase maturation enzyme AslB (radical SAM superfamily)
MKFSNLSFIVTDDCNFNCSYCFQGKEKTYMAPATIEKSIDFFYPYLGDKVDIIFFGGEPLMAYDKIKQAVSLLKEKNSDQSKNFLFNLTTNGMLMNPEMMDFFNKHHFELMLSFDGLTQNSARQSGSHKKLEALIGKTKSYGNIDFAMNSVFTPETVGYLFESFKYVLEFGVGELLLSTSSIEAWDEASLSQLEEQMDLLGEYLLTYYESNKSIPVTAYREPENSRERSFICGAGRHRISIAPDGDVWGCYLFHDYLKEKRGSGDYGAYSFGSLEEFMANHETLYPAILENYGELRQKQFITEEGFCFLCKDVTHCRTCPVNAAYSTGCIGKIPSWLCCLNKIERQAREKFQAALKERN